MELVAQKKNNVKIVLLNEFLGTMFLPVAYNWSSTGSQPEAVGLMYLLLYIQFGGVSDGHFNPAVTLGVLLSSGKIGSDGV